MSNPRTPHTHCPGWSLMPNSALELEARRGQSGQSMPGLLNLPSSSSSFIQEILSTYCLPALCFLDLGGTAVNGADSEIVPTPPTLLLPIILVQPYPTWIIIAASSLDSRLSCPPHLFPTHSHREAVNPGVFRALLVMNFPTCTSLLVKDRGL